MPDMPLVYVTGSGRFEVRRVPPPQAGENDVVVDVRQCGICGSDLGYIASGGLLGPGKPMPLGHELSGVVTEVGKRVAHLSVGDRVVVNPMANDNQIGNGGTEGGFAPKLLVRNVAGAPGAVLKLPDEIDDELGALIEPLSVAMHGVRRSALAPDDSLAIFGAGPIGLGIVIAARYLGVKDIVAVDLSAQRRRLAQQLGAIVIDPAEEDVSERLQQVHGKRALMGMPLPATDVFIEATGVGAVLENIINLAGSGARITVVGVHKAAITLNPVVLLMKELQLSGAMGYPEEFPDVIDMLVNSDIDARQLISHRFPLREFDTALATASDADTAVKVLVDCGGA